METKLLRHTAERNETETEVTTKHAITMLGQRVTAWHDSESDAWAEAVTAEGIARIAAATAYVIMQDHKEKDHGNN